MASDYLWYLPTHGDGRHLSAGAFHRGERGSKHRAPSLDYLTQVALAAEAGEFFGTLIPTGPYCEDAWAVAAAVSRYTKRLRSLVAFRPGFVLPAVAAQTVATLQRFTENRLLLNVVTGGSSSEQRGYGDFLDHDARYERTDEFLSVVRGVWSGPGFEFEGKHYRVDNGGLVRALDPVPTIYFGGASAAAERVAARHADVYLTWGETPPMLVPRIASVRKQAAAHGRNLRIGVRLHLISRDTEAEAWQEAQRLLDGIPAGEIEHAQKQFAASESVGQSRMVGLHHGKVGKARELEVYPNLWAGIGLVRGGAGTAVIGSHEQVAARIAEYEALGVDTFIFSAYPNLEEAVRIGEDLLPLLAGKQRQRSELSLVGAS
ncbi:MAG TPA: LLM class flavin-dependent oxidoreductase [Polyangiaceae bacterium]|nr:LLM class flavin-dependent oxidoreductase [Polyangiaceae bacterium]